MKITQKHMHALQQSFSRCQKMLTAIGDETRQQLLMIMMTLPCSGSRVIEIAEQTHLSRPAVSHHIQILKDAGIVESRKEEKTSITIWHRMVDRCMNCCIWLKLSKN